MANFATTFKSCLRHRIAKLNFAIEILFHYSNTNDINHHFRQIFITYIDPLITYDVMVTTMRDTCGFPRTHPFTVKWLDEDGDPCTISSQRELSEAIRLYEINKEAELCVHGKQKIFSISTFRNTKTLLGHLNCSLIRKV